MTMVYLVQHGDKERLPGDPGLTALGRQQAARTARRGGSLVIRVTVRAVPDGG